ncbi:MAG: hypothetical protein ABI388_07380 [Bacteroidia bacterium]
MKTIKLLPITFIFLGSLIFTNCTNNPKDDNPESTITPASRSTADSVTQYQRDSAAAMSNTTTPQLPVNNAESKETNNPDITK